MKCEYCGKKALDLVGICPDCLSRSAVSKENIDRLRRVNDIVNISTGTTPIMNSIKCLNEVYEDLESKRGQKSEEKEQ